MMSTNKAAAGEQIIRVQTPIKLSSPDGEITQVIETPVPPAPETKA